MGDSDFGDLVNEAEQIAMEIEGTGELPKIERSLRQILEASQALWSRVTVTGAQDIQANLLLGTKGLDLPQITQKLQSLSSRKTFEPLDPIPVTDIQNFLKNEKENAILQLIESTHQATFSSIEVLHKVKLCEEWTEQKTNLMNSLLGYSKQIIDVPQRLEKTVLNESLFGNKSCLSQEEMAYVRCLMDYNNACIQGQNKPNLLEKFAEAAESFNNSKISEMWKMLTFMTQIPPQGRGDFQQARCQPAVQEKMIYQALAYLEQRYTAYMTNVVPKSDFQPKMKAAYLLFALVAGVASYPGDDTRTGIVQLFEWKFSDISKECTDFLGPYGFAGLQTSPINEYMVVNSPSRPWWERYQTMSYEVVSRSGSEDEFKSMVATCNAAGVRVYVDVVFNHMSASWGNNAMGTSGATTDTNDKSYVNVPYSSQNFHSSCAVNNYQDASNVRNCELVGLHDLDQSQEYVRGKMVDYMNKLVSYGVSGFRVDAAKHMWPADLQVIFSRVNNIYDGSRPFIYQEVIDLGGEAVHATDYTSFGKVCDFRFGNEIGRCFHGWNALKYLSNFGTAWGLLDPSTSVIFVDNHDTQRGGGNILNYKLSKNYKMATAFLLSWAPLGAPRIMSSFDFSSNDQGPPHNSDNSIADVVRNADLSCGGGWICEHRWRPIYAMVGFANAVKGTSPSNFWSGSDNQIAYCRGNKGFVALNLDSGNIDTNLQTCLPAGTYCDVITGNKENGSCTGNSVTVDGSGNAHIYLPNTSPDGILAIHVNAKL